MPYANERRNQIAVSLSAASATAVIAAPGAGKRIAIDLIALNPSGGANTVTFTGTITVAFVLNDNQPFTFENTIHDPEGVIHVPDNTAFTITLGAATLVEGFISYRILNG